MVENLWLDTPEKFISLTFHANEPGFGEEHFDRLMTIDKVSIAMWGRLYDDLGNEEKEDLVIAHCLGLPAKREAPTHAKQHKRPQWLPRSTRRI